MPKTLKCSFCGQGFSTKHRELAFLLCCFNSQFHCLNCLRKLSNPLSKQVIQCQNCNRYVTKDMFQLKLQFLTFQEQMDVSDRSNSMVWSQHRSRASHRSYDDDTTRNMSMTRKSGPPGRITIQDSNPRLRQLELDNFSHVSIGRDNSPIPIKKPQIQSKTTIGYGVYKPNQFYIDKGPYTSFYQGSSIFMHNSKTTHATPTKQVKNKPKQLQDQWPQQYFKKIGKPDVGIQKKSPRDNSALLELSRQIGM